MGRASGGAHPIGSGTRRSSEAKQLPGAWVNGATGNILVEAAAHLMEIEGVVGLGANVLRRRFREPLAAVQVFVLKSRGNPKLPSHVPVTVDGERYEVPVMVRYEKRLPRLLHG